MAHPNKPGFRGTPYERWARKVAGPAFLGSFDCWEWTGSKNPKGYGQFYPTQKPMVYAHRWGYEYFVGPIPEGMDLDHLCRNPSCVNPHHLEPVTRRENLMRGKTLSRANAERTHCPQGHPYDTDSEHRPTKHGRQCRVCAGTRDKEKKARDPAYRQRCIEYHRNRRLTQAAERMKANEAL